MNVARYRRYDRLVSLVNKPDKAMLAWMWHASKDMNTYIYAVRYIQREKHDRIAKKELA